MITSTELKLFERKMQDKKYCNKLGNKILTNIAQQNKNSIFAVGDTAWTDWPEWDQFSQWTKE